MMLWGPSFPFRRGTLVELCVMWLKPVPDFQVPILKPLSVPSALGGVSQKHLLCSNTEGEGLLSREGGRIIIWQAEDETF